MSDDRAEAIVEKIAYVERAHYDLMRASLASLEGAEIRDLGYAIVMSDRVLKIPFTNHANCVNIAADEADDLIDGVIAYLSRRGRQPHFFTSPSTRPAHFGERLVAKGFVRLTDEFAWMVHENEPRKDIRPNPEVAIETVDQSNINVRNRVHTAAFATPPKVAAAFAEAYTRTISRKSITHYLAYLDATPVGTTTLISSGGAGSIYNVGTLAGQRRRGIATALMLRAMSDADAKGINTLSLSVRKNSRAERLYENLGFRRLFIQDSYQFYRGKWRF